jgi:hypothetical protein
MSGITVGQMAFYLKTYVNDYRGIKAAVRAAHDDVVLRAVAQWIAS